MNHENAHIGRAYENYVGKWLEVRGYDLLESNHRHASGIQFDLYVRHRITGHELGVECKASPLDVKGEPAMRRSDNVWKVLGYTNVLRMWKEDTGRHVDYVVVTSHAPEPHSVWHEMLVKCCLRGDLQIFEVPWEHGD